MDIDQGPAGEGRKALETIDQSRWLPPDERQHTERVWALGQFGWQLLQEIGWQAVAAAHRIFSVMVEQQANGVGVHGVGIAGLQHQDVWGVHFLPR